MGMVCRPVKRMFLDAADIAPLRTARYAGCARSPPTVCRGEWGRGGCNGKNGEEYVKENVGGGDRVMRFVAGPAMIALGYLFLGGRRGSAAGLATMAAGLLTIESGISRVCPVNRIVGIDTR